MRREWQKSRPATGAWEGAANAPASTAAPSALSPLTNLEAEGYGYLRNIMS